MTADAYLTKILIRENVDTGPASPIRQVQATLLPAIQKWAGLYLNDVQPSGSFAKGTANRSGTDIDLFISLTPATTETLKVIYETLGVALTNHGYSPRKQNVSWNIRVGAVDVDLVPAKQQGVGSTDHSLYRRRADTWTKTNVAMHVSMVRGAGRASESRIIKLWRDQTGLDFPSFYIELAVIAALGIGNPALAGQGSLSANVWTVFKYLQDTLPTARIVDPANTNNIVSDDLSAAAKAAISQAATASLGKKTWDEIVK